MNILIPEFKVNIHAEPIDGLSMDKYDFECQFYVYSNRIITIKKKDMKQQKINGTPDPNNYIAILDSEKVKLLGRGSVKMRFIARVPDSDFLDGTRTEISEVNNLNILI